jgi:hypothetical protein
MFKVLYFKNNQDTSPSVCEVEESYKAFEDLVGGDAYYFSAGKFMMVANKSFVKGTNVEGPHFIIGLSNGNGQSIENFYSLMEEEIEFLSKERSSDEITISDIELLVGNKKI